jgi:hypothetical protein
MPTIRSTSAHGYPRAIHFIFHLLEFLGRWHVCGYFLCISICFFPGFVLGESERPDGFPDFPKWGQTPAALEIFNHTAGVFKWWLTVDNPFFLIKR